MNKLKKLFIITMIIGIFLIASALFSPNPLVVALTGYFLCITSSVCYALNGGK